MDAPLTFQGTISIPDSTSEALRLARHAFHRVSTAASPWLVICHDGSHYDSNSRGGATAVCNKNWLPATSTSQAPGGEELLKESVAFHRVSSSLRAEEAACSLACNMALEEVRSKGPLLPNDTTIHGVMIGDCADLWQRLRRLQSTGGTKRRGKFLIKFIAYQSKEICDLAEKIGIKVHMQGLWCPRIGYSAVRYLGVADRLARQRSLDGCASPFPTCLDLLDCSFKSEINVATEEDTLPEWSLQLLNEGLAEDRARVAATLVGPLAAHPTKTKQSKLKRKRERGEDAKAAKKKPRAAKAEQEPPLARITSGIVAQGLVAQKTDTTYTIVCSNGRIIVVPTPDFLWYLDGSYAVFPDGHRVRRTFINNGVSPLLSETLNWET